MKPETASGSMFWGAVLLAFALLSISFVIERSSSTIATHMFFVFLGLWALAGSCRCFFPVVSERFWSSIGFKLSLIRTMWGIALIGLAAMWIMAAIEPTGDDRPLLFFVLGAGAIVGGAFVLFPSFSERFFKALGIAVTWAFWGGMVGLAAAGVISLLAGAPIPAAIIIGSLIISGAISQSER